MNRQQLELLIEELENIHNNMECNSTEAEVKLEEVIRTLKNHYNSSNEEA